MRRILVLLMAVTLVFAVGAMMVVYGDEGPAPNSGDGVSDGSGFDEGEPGPVGDGDSLGPAPYSGDGVSDGSGMQDDTPNGPNG